MWIKDSLVKKDLCEYEVIVKLREFGLDQHEVELLMLRYIENKPMLEIVKEQGWLSLQSANHYLKRTLAKLRAGNFSFK